MIPSNHLILCRPLLLLPSIFPSIRVFSNESTLHIRWPKYWSFSLNISPSNEHSGWSPLGWTGWISLHPRESQESSKASILRCSAFFTVQLSHPYMTTGKTIALTRWTFVGKVMSLLFNVLSRLAILSFQGVSVFWFHGYNHYLQSFWSPKNKVSHCFHRFTFYLPWGDGTGSHDLSFLNVEL